MTHLISAMAAFAQVAGAATPVIWTIEPIPASPWTLTFEASCHRTRLRIEGYGPRRPGQLLAQIRINGHPASGEGTSALARDLSRHRAVYRFSALCSQREDGWLQLRIYSGEKAEDGALRYLAGSAEIFGGKLHYRGLEPSNAETFWFR